MGFYILQLIVSMTGIVPVNRCDYRWEPPAFILELDYLEGTDERMRKITHFGRGR
jgi:hypothetical protein